MLQPRTYTPQQVAQILQLSKNTVYELINRGEIMAKKFGKVYRIPSQAISFVFTGLDNDLTKAQAEDETKLQPLQATLKKVRKSLWRKTKSF